MIGPAIEYRKAREWDGKGGEMAAGWSEVKRREQGRIGRAVAKVGH